MAATLIMHARAPSGIEQFPLALAEAPEPSFQPLFEHKVAAGFPSPASDYIEDALDLNEFLVRHKAASYYFNVVGDSMRDAGILDGDKVLVDRSVAPRDGHVVIAVIDSEYTLKRLSIEFGIVELRPANPAYKPIRLADGQQLEVWGVVAGVVRKIRV